MNNFFSLKRFCRLFVKHTVEHYRTYLMSIAVLTGVILLGGSFLFFIVPEPPDTAFQTAAFIILMLIAGCIFTSTVFMDFGEKNKAIPALTLPATAFEKFLVGWIYSYPVFLLVYTAIFYLVVGSLGVTRHHFVLFSLQQGEMPALFVLFSILHAITLFGAILFRNLHFIKTGFTFFISYALLLICNTVFLKLITGLAIVKPAMPYGFLNFNEGPKYYSISADGPDSLTIMITIMLVTVLIWTAAYFRLKEKQV
ncbi:MAG TPA: hypothetical protein VIM89_10360 [Mucilaginibacter sp.]